MKRKIQFKLVTVLFSCIYLLGISNSKAQKVIQKHCYFKNHQNPEYYVKLVDEYKTKSDLTCFVNMIDSLMMWSDKDSMEKKIKIFEAIFNNTDGAFSEREDQVIEFLSELYFGDFAKFMMANKSSTIRRYFIEYYGRHIYDSEFHDARRDKFYETFDAKIEKSKLNEKDKTKAKAFIHSLKFEGQ